MDNKFEPNMIDSGLDDAECFSDSEIQSIQMKRTATTTGIADITKAIRNTTFSGSGLKNEIIELEENMRHLLSEGKYGYKFIESTLIGIGYPLSSIREIFERLTGVSVEKWMNVDQINEVPGNIPGINYGWGEAKNGSYDFYFIMPYKCGYSLFGQKGDLQRDEVDYFDYLEQAKEALISKVKDAKIWDKPVKINDLKEFPKGNLSEPTQMALTASEDFPKLDQYLYDNIDRMDTGTIEKIIKRAKLNEVITDEEYKILKSSYITIRAEDGVSDIEDETGVDDINEEGNKDMTKAITEIVDKDAAKTMEEPFENFENEETPSDYFKNEDKDTKMETVPADVIDKILTYINYKNEGLNNFEIEVKGFKYTSLDVIDDIQKTMTVDEDTKEVFFDANANVTLMMTIKNLSLPQGDNEKKAIAIFSVIKGDITTADYCKSTDNLLYAITEEGLSKLFK